jgi:phosphoglycolate phosphatase-like HAD superfamily hydrolase
VEEVSTADSRHFVPVEERIAVFDNDGTLWVEQPMYSQLRFAIDRVKALASSHPEWKRTQPFKAALEDDQKALAASGHEGLFELISGTHAGMTTEQFHFIVEEWLSSAKHPRFDRPYDELTYAPMVELLAYLRAHGFKTFIVSGGGVDFMRVFTEEAYGIPPEQVIGSAMVTEYKIQDGVPVIEREPEILYIDDKELKPVLIERIIGRQPILAVGNSDGDLQMLKWSTAGAGKRLGVLVHHTDAEREYRYDRESSVGKLDQALELAPEMGWIVVDMKSDWERVFTFD